MVRLTYDLSSMKKSNLIARLNFFHKSIQDNKGNNFWLKEIIMKMFALTKTKLSKITSHSLIATEFSRKHLPKREMGNLPNPCNFIF